MKKVFFLLKQPHWRKTFVVLVVAGIIVTYLELETWETYLVAAFLGGIFPFLNELEKVQVPALEPKKAGKPLSYSGTRLASREALALKDNEAYSIATQLQNVRRVPIITIVAVVVGTVLLSYFLLVVYMKWFF